MHFSANAVLRCFRRYLRSSRWWPPAARAKRQLSPPPDDARAAELVMQRPKASWAADAPEAP